MEEVGDRYTVDLVKEHGLHIAAHIPGARFDAARSEGNRQLLLRSPESRTIHAEPIEHSFLQEVAVVLPAHALDDQSENDIVRVTVPPRRVRCAPVWPRHYEPEHILRCPQGGRLLDFGEVEQAAPVDEQIVDRQTLERWVVRKVLGHIVIDGQQPFVLQHENADRGERLGQRPDPESCVLGRVLAGTVDGT